MTTLDSVQYLWKTVSQVIRDIQLFGFNIRKEAKKVFM